jgi:hypothetical protein
MLQSGYGTEISSCLSTLFLLCFAAYIDAETDGSPPLFRTITLCAIDPIRDARASPPTMQQTPTDADPIDDAERSEDTILVLTTGASTYHHKQTAKDENPAAFEIQVNVSSQQTSHQAQRGS